MPRKSRSRIVAALAICMLSIGAAGIAQAAGRPVPSFDVAWCFAPEVGIPEDEGYQPDRLVATISWSGYVVDAISLGAGDGTGAGFGFVEPLSRPSRTGSETRELGIDNESVIAGASILFRDAVLQDEDLDQPGGGWSALGAC